MKRLISAGLVGVVAVAGISLVLAACSTSESTSAADSLSVADAVVDEVEGNVDPAEKPVEEPAGPRSDDIDSAVVTAQEELNAQEGLLESNELLESGLVVEFNTEQADYRAAGDSFLEVIATSDDGSYVIGKVDEVAAARISLVCPGEQPADLLISDKMGRSDQEWVPIIDQLVPSFVAASGCEATILGSPTDCLDLPNDPAACISGDGVGQ